MDEETEIEQGSNCPRSHSEEVAKAGFTPTQVACLGRPRFYRLLVLVPSATGAGLQHSIMVSHLTRALEMDVALLVLAGGSLLLLRYIPLLQAILQASPASPSSPGHGACAFPWVQTKPKTCPLEC